jgi:hypothetical protein
MSEPRAVAGWSVSPQSKQNQPAAAGGSDKRVLASLMLCVVILITQTSAFAFETAQYNLPPKPLADIGDEVTEHVEQRLQKAVDKVNAEILGRQECLANDGRQSKTNSCNTPGEERARLADLRSNDAVTKEAFNQLGAGVPPFTSMGTWVDLHHFAGQPARYRTGYLKSIFIYLPTIALTVSPTVNLYGSQFGTDKIAHLFQQGYSYYKIYGRAINAGATAGEATQKAVSWGKMTERTYYGTLVAGVYSNGDLAANFVGLKFYLGLTREIRIGEVARPPILLLRNGVWIFNEGIDLRELLVKPFISDHLNEALNPSIFTKNLGLRDYVRWTVRQQSCQQWFEKYPGITRDSLEETSSALRLWHVEDYGFTDNKHFVTIANTCFETQN